MHIRLRIIQRAMFASRVLEIGDVLDVNLATGECFVAAPLPFNPGALAGLLADGTADPVEAARAEVATRLISLSSPSATPAPRLRLVKGSAG